VGWFDDPLDVGRTFGAQAVAAAGQFVAVGTSSGAVVVLQLPPAHPQQPQQQGAAPPAGGAPAAAGGAAVWALGDGPKPELGPVTALAFSHPAGAQDALWLAAGHAGGVVAVWEIQKRGGKQVATIGEASRAPCLRVSFAPVPVCLSPRMLHPAPHSELLLQQHLLLPRS
jgi:hypothetical protein